MGNKYIIYVYKRPFDAIHRKDRQWVEYYKDDSWEKTQEILAFASKEYDCIKLEIRTNKQGLI